MNSRILLIIFIIGFKVFAIPTDPNRRPGSYPFICGDTFRKFCDHIVDETSVVFNPINVQQGETIFLCANYLEKFFSEYHHRISVSYILVTHNSDVSVPGKFAHYLDDSKIFAWFGQNTDCIHAKLYPIPIGIANAHWSHGDVAPLKRAISQMVPLKNKKNKDLIYVNFNINNNKRVRQPIWDDLFKQSFAYCVAKPRAHQEYLEEMEQYCFVASPRGNGIDCHRTWEALLLGCVAVVDKTTISAVYEGLPVIEVEDWNLVSAQFLKEKYSELLCQPLQLDKLYADYWFEKIRLHQKLCKGV
ncbi:MAG: hypothetical protein WD449_00705 [Candidatus Babeliales bacterium]